MPLLKLKCQDCSNVFEELTSSIESVKCPECGGSCQRHYQGKCYVGGTSTCSGSCSGCSGCSK